MIAKVITGVLALGAVIGALVFGASFAVEDVPVSASTTIPVTPARQDIACPGPLATPSGGTSPDPELGGAATETSRSTYLTGDVRAVANGQASDGVVGATVERVGGGDITGLSAVTCSAPLTDQWIVAGTTSIGSSARLVLTNPSDSAVEATVTAFGELGGLDARQVAIGPDSQQVVLLEGVVVDVAALAVRIEATGTGVVAALQDSRLNGFQPFGTDWAGPSAVAAELALPGIGTQGLASQVATVRLVAPEGATVRLALSTPEGAAVWEGVAALDLEPGVVVEVTIPAVDEGTVTVHADAPVVAGAVLTRSRPATSGVDGDTASELRWIASQLPGDVGERAAVAIGYAQRVVVFAESAGTFTLSDPDGDTVANAALGAGESISLPVEAAPGTVLTAGGAFAWALVAQDGNLITSIMPTRTTIDDRDIVVEQRSYVPES